MQQIHWDYADSFSGRDAAYLIAGFDPSSNSAEDAYRAQYVIRKLKDSYYAGSTALAKFLRGDGDTDKVCNWKRLVTFEKDKSHLTSIVMERMVTNFAESEFVIQGHLQAIEEIESIISAGFPKQELINSLRDQVEAVDIAIGKSLFEIDPVKAKRFSELNSLIANLQEKRHKFQLSMKQYQIESRPFFEEKNELSEFAEVGYAEQNPESYGSYRMAIAELSILNASARDWADDQATERGVRLQKGKHSFIAADLESEKWAGVVNEFDEQSFSRSELQRWVTENGQQSQYQFSAIVEAKEKVRPATEGWDGFDPEDKFYPEELDIAMQAWRAVTNGSEKGKPLQLLKDYILKTHPSFRPAKVTRIATLCNWDRSPGRPGDE